MTLPRLFQEARWYGHEADVARAIKDEEGVSREDCFIVTKLSAVRTQPHSTQHDPIRAKARANATRFEPTRANTTQRDPTRRYPLGDASHPS